MNLNHITDMNERKAFRSWRILALDFCTRNIHDIATSMLDDKKWFCLHNLNSINHVNFIRPCHDEINPLVNTFDPYLIIRNYNREQSISVRFIPINSDELLTCNLSQDFQPKRSWKYVKWARLNIWLKAMGHLTVIASDLKWCRIVHIFPERFFNETIWIV